MIVQVFPGKLDPARRSDRWLLSYSGHQLLEQWPGLAPGELYEDQDMKVTIDYRDILAEVLTKRACNPNIDAVFNDPSYVFQDRGIIG